MEDARGSAKSSCSSVIQDQFRVCTSCPGLKPASDFYPKGKRLDSKCKACKLKEKRDKYAAKKGGQTDVAPIAVITTPTVVERTCSRCDKTKPLVDFAKRDAKTYKKFCNECWNKGRRKNDAPMNFCNVDTSLVFSEIESDWSNTLFQILKPYIYDVRDTREQTHLIAV